MQKRAQLTTFIITGLFVLLAVALLLFARKPAEEIARQTEFLAATTAVKANIESCLEIVGSDALAALAFLGGRTKLYPPYFSSENFNTNYNYFGGVSKVPSVAEMEAELGAFVDSNLANCADFSQFPAINFEPGKVAATATIAKNSVVLRVDWPVLMRQAEFSKEYSEFAAKFSPMRLGLLQQSMKKIAAKTASQPLFVDALFLLELGINATFTNYNNSVVYLLTDPGSMLRGKNYFMMFATKIA